MKLQQPYKCDYCTNVKGAANHWWLRKPLDAPPESFYLRPWNEVLADMDGVEHICSEQCAAKALSRWMAAQRVSTLTKVDITAGTITSWPPAERLALVARCPICTWALAEDPKDGCVPGNCSYRPAEGTSEWWD